jgi:hypothetical protein
LFTHEHVDLFMYKYIKSVWQKLSIIHVWMFQVSLTEVKNHIFIDTVLTWTVHTWLCNILFIHVWIYQGSLTEVRNYSCMNTSSQFDRSWKSYLRWYSPNLNGSHMKM